MRRRMPRLLIAAAAAVLVATGAAAQPAADRSGTSAPPATPEAYADALRRTDPEAYTRWTRLREEREASIAELQRAQDRYRIAGPELRALSVPQLRAARRRYAAAELALLDFLDARDRLALEQYRNAIENINGLLEQRARAREELRDLTKD